MTNIQTFEIFLVLAVAACLARFFYVQASFRRDIVKALGGLHESQFQRIDGLQCEPGILDKNYKLFSLRLKLMKAEGIIESIPTRSFFPSCNGMLAYALTDKGREYGDNLHTN